MGKTISEMQPQLCSPFTVPRSPFLTLRYSLFIIRQSAVHFLSSVVRLLSSAFRSPATVIRNPLSVICNPTTNHRLPTPITDNRPPITAIRSTFTLIELLVVIAIISILLAMLLPVLKKAKDLSRTVLCLNNMRQTSTTFIMYAGDFDFYMPHYNQGNFGLPPSASTGSLADRSRWPMIYTYWQKTPDPSDAANWNGGTIPLPTVLLAGVPIFNCPTLQAAPKTGGWWWGSNWWHYQASIDPNVRLSQFKTNEILMIERGTESWCGTTAWGGDDCLAAFGISWTATSTLWNGWGSSPYNYVQVGWHHSNGVNIAFPDGHVTRHNRIDYMPNYKSGDWRTTRYVGNPTSVK